MFLLRQIGRFVLRAGRMVFGLAALAAIGALGACATSHSALSHAEPRTNSALPPDVLALISSAELPLNSVSILVQPLNRRAQARLSYNVDVPMQPGSTMKLITSVVALERLGPLHRGRVEWRGTLSGAADASNTALAGTSVIRGVGHAELNVEATNRWLKSLMDSGVREISGTVVIDRSHYSPTRPDLGLTPFDEAPEFRYNVVPDALSLNMNLMGVRLQSTSTTVSLAMDPPLAGVALTGDFKLIDASCPSWENGWVLPVVVEANGTATVKLSGTFPRNCKASTQLNVLDRTRFAHGFLASLWRQMGGVWSAAVREATPAEVLPAGQILASSSARPLSELLREINKISDNPITRMTFLALGTQSAAVGANHTADRAAASVKAWMTDNQIDTTGLVLDNGSGLSRSERISARTLGQVLQVAGASRWAPELQASMPIVGVDGTMRNRLKNTAAQERARMKTGTLRNAYAVAGYVRDAADQPLVVVAMLNDEKVQGKTARAVLDAVIEWAAKSRGSKISLEVDF